MQISLLCLYIGLILLVSGIRIKVYDKKIERIFPVLHGQFLDNEALKLGLKRKKWLIFKESNEKLKKRMKAYINLNGLRNGGENIARM